MADDGEMIEMFYFQKINHVFWSTRYNLIFYWAPCLEKHRLVQGWKSIDGSTMEHLCSGIAEDIMDIRKYYYLLSDAMRLYQRQQLPDLSYGCRFFCSPGRKIDKISWTYSMSNNILEIRHLYKMFLIIETKLCFHLYFLVRICFPLLLIFPNISVFCLNF